MGFGLRQKIVTYLREVADKIDAGTSEITESEAMDILSIIAHEALSKEQACLYLNGLSRSRFDDLVREGKIPKGRKVAGYKELRWYKDDLDLAIHKMQKNKK